MDEGLREFRDDLLAGQLGHFYNTYSTLDTVKWRTILQIMRILPDVSTMVRDGRVTLHPVGRRPPLRRGQRVINRSGERAGLPGLPALAGKPRGNSNGSRTRA